MSTSGEEVKVLITGSATGAEEAMRAGADAVSSGVGQMKDSLQDLKQQGDSAFQGLGEQVRGLREIFQQAFEFTGLIAAYEGVSKLGDMVEQLTSRAVQMRSMSEVLNLSTAQFQGLSLAASESGVSVETTARSVERFEVALNEAREGSSAAIEKLHEMGITNEQIQSSTFTINELLGVLHGRLNDVTDAEATRNAILKELGPRGALVIEVIRAYDGSLQGIAKSMADVNGLFDKQIGQLKDLHTWWDRLKSQAENMKSGLLAGWFENAGSGHSMDGDSLLEAQAAAKDRAQPSTGGGGDASGAAGAAANAATTVKESLQGVSTAISQVTLREVEDAKTAIDTFKQGSDERLAAVRAYADLAAKYYGSDQVDKVRAANAQLLTEERIHTEERQRLIQGLSDESQALATRTTNEKARLMEQEMAASARATKEEDRQIEEVSNYAIELKTRAMREHAKVLEQMMALNEKVAQPWVRMADQIANSWSKMLTGMLMHTTSWASALRGIETQVLQNTIHNITQSVTRHIAAEAQKADAAKTGSVLQTAAAADAAHESVAHSAWAALKKIGNDAESAASGAFQAVVGIPYVGPILAPIAAGVAFGAVIAFESGIASAAGGFDIPAGVNPVTQLHEREMVLPAQLADTVRAMASGGSDQGGGKTLNLNLHALDGQSVEKWLRNGGAALISKGLGDHHRFA